MGYASFQISLRIVRLTIPASGRLHLPFEPSAAAQFEWKDADFLSDGDLANCSELFSNHYGVWGPRGERPKEPVHLSAERLRRALVAGSSWAALAKVDGQLIAYAFAVRFDVPDRGRVSWVTRLVVHREYRNMGYAKRLLSGVWAFSDHYAWGLTTPNPYAVRALEKATRRRCDPEVIGKEAPVLLPAVRSYVDYIKDAPLTVDAEQSVIDSKFFVAHRNLKRMIAAASTKEPWRLGILQPGEEWFAVATREQEEFPLDSEELESILSDADETARRAYEGMALDSRHHWMKYTSAEIDFVVKYLNVEESGSVLDFGCGNGRHAIELAKRGRRVVAVDFAPRLISQARENARAESAELASFLEADCRDVELDEQFDAALCLYDVVGTFPSDEENARILSNLRKHLKPGARAIISVLNFTPAYERALNMVDDIHSEPWQLLELPPSRTMQKSGQIFDPKYYLIDRGANLVYRKEQFDGPGDRLPAELIVRDHRYTRNEIEALCSRVGFVVLELRPVRAGHWEETSLEEADPKSRELLVLLENPSSVTNPKSEESH